MHIDVLDSVEHFLGSLTAKELAKVIRTIELLEEFGATLGMPHSKHLSGGLLELRVRGGREIRVFYCFSEQRAVLLHAYIKKTQKAPDKELHRAKKAMQQLQ